MAVYIDKSMIMQLATALLVTATGTGYVIVPVGGVDPENAAVIIRMLSCDVAHRRRNSLDENDLADVRCVVSVEVSAAREESDQATMDGVCAKVVQSMSFQYQADATTDHQLHTDQATVQEAEGPDEQRRIRAAIVTIVGWCRRGSGTSIAHP